MPLIHSNHDSNLCTNDYCGCYGVLLLWISDVLLLCTLDIINVVSTAVGLSHFGRPSVPILLDEVRCAGEETRLIDCPANTFGQHDCSNLEGAGVVCTQMEGECIFLSVGIHILCQSTTSTLSLLECISGCNVLQS